MTDAQKLTVLAVAATGILIADVIIVNKKIQKRKKMHKAYDQLGWKHPEIITPRVVEGLKNLYAR